MLGQQQSYSLQTSKILICGLKQDTSVKEWIVVPRRDQKCLELFILEKKGSCE